jgi:hypothetical protein
VDSLKEPFSKDEKIDNIGCSFNGPLLASEDVFKEIDKNLFDGGYFFLPFERELANLTFKFFRDSEPLR